MTNLPNSPEKVPPNAKVKNPVTVAQQRWTWEAERWDALNKEAGGWDDFYPLTIKAAYVLGVIHDICESVDWLLKRPQAWLVTYPSAFGLCAAGMELLGRCIEGNEGTGDNTRDLKSGFEWLRSSTPRPGISPNTLAITQYNNYDIDRLVTLRHFVLHGQATVRHGQAIVLDVELLNDFPWLIGNAIERYWTQILYSDDYCEQLAKASVYPLRSEPIRKMWRFFDKEGTSAGTPFYGFNWRIRVSS